MNLLLRFIAVNTPEANDLTAGTKALVVQQEREAIAALRRAGKGGAPLRAAVARAAERIHLGKPIYQENRARLPEGH